jgi:orotate phosphoribosyltransferase
MNYPDDATRRVRNIINDECIVRVPSGSKELPAMQGRGHYTWQFYLRRAVLDPLCLDVVCEDFWSKNCDLFGRCPFQIAGVESASAPLITAILLSGHRRGLGLNAFTIRKHRKDYGRRNLIEGRPTTDPVFIVDDLTSPEHNSFWHAVHAIASHGLALNGLGYVLVLKMRDAESRVISTSLGPVHIQSLFTLGDFALTVDEYQKEKLTGATP